MEVQETKEHIMMTPAEYKKKTKWLNKPYLSFFFRYSKKKKEW